MNVLSLFDGISCGQLALQRAGIKVDNYFASEVDAKAIAVTQRHFPNTIQLGDVRNIKAKDLPKIDLVLAGSPCQGLSVCGKRLGFDDPRSALFWEFVRILDEVDPTYWLLENVRMAKEDRDTINEALGVEGVKINSNLISCQNRDRYYWFNIPYAGKPEDKHIYVKDILESDVEAKYWLTEDYLRSKNLEWLNTLREEVMQGLNQVTALCPNNAQAGRVYDFNGKSPALTALGGGLGAKTGLYMCPKIIQRTTRGPNNDKGIKEGYAGKLPYITTSNWEHNFYAALEYYGIRRFTPIEAERAQTIPDNYTEGYTPPQRYKLVGNAWTVDVVAHLLKGINL